LGQAGFHGVINFALPRDVALAVTDNIRRTDWLWKAIRCQPNCGTGGKERPLLRGVKVLNEYLRDLRWRLSCGEMADPI
jgi:hypothetical protein